eukprot:4088661-Amphidinium_carterae.1
MHSSAITSRTCGCGGGALVKASAFLVMAWIKVLSLLLDSMLGIWGLRADYFHRSISSMPLF